MRINVTATTMQPPRWAIQEAMDELGDDATLEQMLELAGSKVAEDAAIRADERGPAMRAGTA